MDTPDIQLLISAATFIAILVGLRSILFQKKEIHFLTIQKCIDNHREILRKQQKKSGLKGDHIIYLRDHLGLITEELFYMRRDYLPKALAKNWIRHMIEFTPIKISGMNSIINETQIMNSKEVSYFLESTINANMSNSQKEQERKKNYLEYKRIVSDKKSFSQINIVFQITKEQYKKLQDDNNYKIKYDDKIKKRLVNYIWNNNKQQTKNWWFRIF